MLVIGVPRAGLSMILDFYEENRKTLRARRKATEGAEENLLL